MFLSPLSTIPEIFRYKILGMGIRNFVVIIINYPYYREAMILFSFRIFIRSNTENLGWSDIIWWRG